MKPDATIKRWDWKTRRFVDTPTVKASTARAFLEANKGRATLQSARLNPHLSRKEAWEILSKDVAKLKDDDPVHYRVYKNLLREFGGRR